MINVHASLLPRYRGAAPVHRAIIEGEAATGVTIMRVVKALDAGPMLAHVRRAIGRDATSEDVERDLARLGAPLLVTVVNQLASGSAQETPQDDTAATYAHRLTKDDGRIDWSQSAARLHDRVRGLHPWPHAFTYLRGQRLILHRAIVATDVTAIGEPGAILVAEHDRLIVAAGDGALQLTQLQTEGKRPLTAREFLAGHAVAPGDRLTAAR
jgi:methionyl-tRNA formyltransferase